jgi:uncharacterized protein YndB with AHSA1/START domain
MSEIRIVREYPHPPEKVWRAVTDPELIPLWTATGQGARPEGFSTVVGTRFRFVAKPIAGWDGVVQCEVLEAREPSLLRYSWFSGEGGDVTEVTLPDRAPRSRHPVYVRAHGLHRRPWLPPREGGARPGAQEDAGHRPHRRPRRRTTRAQPSR